MINKESKNKYLSDILDFISSLFHVKYVHLLCTKNRLNKRQISGQRTPPNTDIDLWSHSVRYMEIPL